MQQSIQPLVPAPLAYKPQRNRTDVFSALVRASREFGAGKTILVDGDERELSYKEIIRAAFGLGSALKKGTKRGEAMAIMLPTGAGAVIAFYAIPSALQSSHPRAGNAEFHCRIEEPEGSVEGRKG